MNVGRWNLSTQFEFGEGAFHRLADRASEADVFWLFSKSARSQVQNLFPHIKFRNDSVVDVPTLADTEWVNLVYARIVNRKYSTVIGVGGGQCLDAAKALAVMLDRQVRDCCQLFNVEILDRNHIELILVPTTAGTGSELSRASILFEPKTCERRAIRGLGVAANQAFIDFSLSVSCPQRVTAESGFDVFSHGVETFCSRRSTFMSRGVSLEVIRLVVSSLPGLIADLENIELRAKISWASTLAGMCLANVGTCLPHRIQYAFSGLRDISHGAGLARIYPAWTFRTKNFNGRFSEIESALGISDFEELIQKIRESAGLRKRGFPESNLNLDTLAEKVIGNLGDDPGYSAETLRLILSDLISHNY